MKQRTWQDPELTERIQRAKKEAAVAELRLRVTRAEELLVELEEELDAAAHLASTCGWKAVVRCLDCMEAVGGCNLEDGAAALPEALHADLASPEDRLLAKLAQRASSMR